MQGLPRRHLQLRAWINIEVLLPVSMQTAEWRAKATASYALESLLTALTDMYSIGGRLRCRGDSWS